MARDLNRINLIQSSLREENLDALVCALPANVLLLTGYWPVVGTSIAIALRGLPTILIVPEDERDLIRHDWGSEVSTFHPGSLDDLRTDVEAVHGPLTQAVRSVANRCKRVGFESGGMAEPASYAAMHLYGPEMVTLLGQVFPAAALIPASEVLSRLQSVKTPDEIEYIREGCQIAAVAFQGGIAHLGPRMTERQAAESFHMGLANGGEPTRACRIGGFTWCMSGPNSAKACAPYARSTQRLLTHGDLMLIHCNSYLDGYWTDITRTYCLGSPSDRNQQMAESVLAARAAALETIRPGVKGSTVDAAARDVLRDRGLGQAFKHSIGHGVGFGAISAQGRPRLHPKSPDVLQTGMVFNVEPALYFNDYGGFRHCDMVVVTPTGGELLTPFHASLAELTLP